MSLEVTSGPSVAARHAEAIDDAIRRASLGEAEAFEVLFRCYAPRLRAFAEVRANPDADALANDVMLRVFRRLSSFTGDERAFTRWVFTIARNLLIDAHRSAQRRPNLSSARVPERPTRSSEDVAVEQLTSGELVSLLDGLSVDQREVVALRILDDMSLADVAAVVGRSVAAVKGLQRRGLRHLEAELLARSTQ